MVTTSFHLLLVSVTEPFMGFSSNSVQEFFTEIGRTSLCFIRILSSERQARALLTRVNEYLSIFSTFTSPWMGLWWRSG